MDVTPVATPPAEVEVAPVENPTPPAPVEEVKPEPKKPVVLKPVIYTVTAGDSVSALAVRFGLHKPDILALNPELAKNPNNLKIGQKVKLPAGTDLSIKAKPRAPKKPVTTPANGAIYTVKAGDVLGGIALANKVKIADLKKANNLKNDNIFVGQKLIIPGAKKAQGPIVVKEDPEKKAPKKKPAPKKPTETKKVEPPKPEPTPAPTPTPVVPEETIPEEVIPDVVVEETIPEDIPSVDDTPPAPVVDENATTYVVKEGEDLLAVACRWNISVSTLRAANNIDEAAGYAIAPGTTLIIPNAE
jgi:LysM repeat protein